MDQKNLHKITISIFIVASICLVLLISGCAGPSSEVKGTILQHTGEPFAKEEVVLIPLMPGDKVNVIEEGNLVFAKYEAPLENLKPRVGGLMVKVLCAVDRRGTCKWKTKTDNTGSFIIKNVNPGKYVLLQWLKVTSGTVRIRTDEGLILVNVQEEGTNDIGTITLKK